MNIILIKAAQLLLCLSLLVVLHEGGHFGFAKLFKTRVTRFYMFANWGFHLFSTYDNWFRRLIGKPLITKRGNEGQNFFAWLRNTYYRLTGQKDRIQTENIGNKEYDDNVGTEYGIGWLPIGGYVAIAGMIDETNQKFEGEPQPWEFRSKPVWQRFLIMVGGVLMNLLTAFAIYSGIMFFVGEERLPMQNITQGFVYNTEAEAIGFRDGDIPVKIDGEYIQGWTGALVQDISKAGTITVLRDGREVTLDMPSEGINLLQMIRTVPPFMTMASEATVDSVFATSAAGKAGMKNGARLVAVDGCPIRYWNDYDSLYMRKQDALALKSCTHSDSLRLRKMTITYRNPDSEATTTATIMLDKNYMLGVVRHLAIMDYDTEHISYDILSCIPAGIKYGWHTLANYVSSLKYVATKEGAQEVGSFIAIGDMFPATWDWLRFWTMTAFISIVLAVMNILPIPGLDGGHVAILLYEGITGRQPSEKVLVWLEYIGMGCLIALMLLAFGNDIRRFIL